jgi:polysaccharide pyruvyl transferase WcaK-like protein
MHVHIGHTFFGAGNFGDDLVIGGFLRGIAASIPELKITCATPFDRDAQARRFPQIEWSSYDPASRRMLIATCDVWLGLGGTIFHEFDDSWLLVDQALQLEDCRRHGKPAFFLCCSVDHRIDSHRPEIRAILDTASWIWTRDSLSTAALKTMGFDRVTTAADLAHLSMQTVSHIPVVPTSTGFVCNFEQGDHYSIELLVRLIAAEQAASRTVAWLVQEMRALPGSELDIYHRLPVQTQQLLRLCKPDYGSDSVSELVGGWQGCDRLFSTRFHAAIVGAWSGSRVVTFERQRKLRGLAEDLGMVSFSSMPDPDSLARAFDRARPVRQSALTEAVHRAEAACRSFLKAADAAIPRSLRSGERCRGETSVKDLPQPRLEHHSLDGVTQVGLDRDGVVVISNLPESAPSTVVGQAEHYRKEVEHFTHAADRFHAALRIYVEARGQWGLATVCHARTAAVHALLGLPGSVIRDSLEAPATRLISAILGSDDRRVSRTAEEETTFRECWRRLGRSWDEEAAFSYGLALLALSRHGFELIGLEPLARDLGWTEPLWLRCLLETMPVSAQMDSPHPAADNLPRLMAQIRDRMTRLDPTIKDGILRARDDTASFIGSDHFDGVSEADTASLRLQVQTLTDQLKEANADRELSHQQIQTLAGHLREANADRELSHQQIQILSGHLTEANADRELSHQNIHTLAKHLKEANADRELSHQHIQTLASDLKQANANLEAVQNGRIFMAIRKLSTILGRVRPRRAP